MTPCTLALALAFSSHLGLAGDYNEVHPALKCDRDDTGLIAGVYLNSEDRASAYAGIKLAGDGPFWAELGVVSGYKSHDFLPMARVGVDLKGNLSLFAAPAFEEDRRGNITPGLVVGLEIKFGGGF